MHSRHVVPVVIAKSANLLLVTLDARRLASPGITVALSRYGFGPLWQS
jgi:hypothetical protein